MSEIRKRPVYISRLVLKNRRNFRDVDVLLERRVFLVGPNASGKSGFLDSLRFCTTSASSEAASRGR